MEFAKWQNKETAKTEAIDVEVKETSSNDNDSEDVQDMSGNEVGDGISAENSQGEALQKASLQELRENTQERVDKE